MSERQLGLFSVSLDAGPSVSVDSGGNQNRGVGRAHCSQSGLDAVAAEVRQCVKCPLGQFRKNVVPGEGNPDANLMLVGEGPGAEEDLQGRPFVGAAGRLLDKILSAMGLSRDQVYIANVVKCRPPGNRIPEPGEIQCCLPYLMRQIECLKPKVVVVLGATAYKALVDPNGSITKARGKWVRKYGVAIMPTFHPAALLRDPAKKRPVWEDMLKVRTELGIGE